MSIRLIVMSDQKLTQSIQGLPSSFPASIELEIVDALLEDAIKIARSYEKQEKVDVFVSGGANAVLLEKNVETPTVTIKVTGFDLLTALRKAKQYSDDIVVMSYAHKIPELDTIEEILNVKVHQTTYFDKGDAEQKLHTLKQQGFKIVVGASLVHRIAQNISLQSVFIYSQESIGRALEEAVKLALSKRNSYLKNKQFEAVLDLTDTGIIGMDKSGAITLMNRATERILQVKAAACIGRPIQQVLPGSDMLDVLKSGKKKAHQFLTIDQTKTLTSRRPLVINGEVEGVVASFHDIKHIQKVEETIRTKLHETGLYAKHTFKDIVGKSTILQNKIDIARGYALTESTILITGESGTGKELFAQSIHNASQREANPFVAINCAALPENLLESELFGYVDGAFTGAKKGGKPGLFELAHGGTIFLDEIGDISLSLQTRLLRVLQEREVMRIGGDKIIPVNCRILCATNKNLYQMVTKEDFRQDLYYRINVLQLDLPPLRERAEDIPLLLDHFIDKLPGTTQVLRQFFADMESILIRYSWPGNIRELENAVEKYTALIRTLDSDTLCTELLRQFHHPYTKVVSETSYHEKALATSYSPQKVSDHHILQAIQEANGNRNLAAEILGMSRVTLWRRLKKMNSRALEEI